MKSQTVRVMAPVEEDLAVETIMLAFATDPMTRWTWPDAHQYLAAMPRMIRAFGRSAFSNGSAFCTDGYAGTAWRVIDHLADRQKARELVDSLTVAFSTLSMASYYSDEPSS